MCELCAVVFALIASALSLYWLDVSCHALVMAMSDYKEMFHAHTDFVSALLVFTVVGGP